HRLYPASHRRTAGRRPGAAGARASAGTVGPRSPGVVAGPRAAPAAGGGGADAGGRPTPRGGGAGEGRRHRARASGRPARMKQLIFMILLTLAGTVGVFLYNPFWGVAVYYLFAVLRPQYMWEWALRDYVKLEEGAWSFYVAVATILAMIGHKFRFL